MKRILVAVVMGVLALGPATQAHANDWDKAGIALTGIEGLRVISGGKVDLIGSMFGINNREHRSDYYKPEYRSREHGRGRWSHQEYGRHCECEQDIWVPHYQWRKKYVPRHIEYRPGHGRVVVEGHYEKYKVEVGGHWEAGHCSF